MSWLSVATKSVSQHATGAVTSPAVLLGTLRHFNSCTAACKDEVLEGSSPSSGELYGREDRDPMPSPNPAVKQSTMEEMSFPRDSPDSSTQGTKPESIDHPDAYPVANDPSIPSGAGPDVEAMDSTAAQKLQQQDPEQSAGPKAAGQGVVEELAKKDPETYGSGRGSPA